MCKLQLHKEIQLSMQRHCNYTVASIILLLLKMGKIKYIHINNKDKSHACRLDFT